MKALIIFFISAIFIFPGNTFSQWQQIQTTGPFLHNVQFVTSSTGWVTGGSLIFNTTDSGNNWLSQFPDGPYYSGYFISVNTGWIAGPYGRISKTTDGGDNWSNYNVDNNIFIYSVHFPDPMNGHAVGRFGNRNDGVALKTIDGGITWSINEIEFIGFGYLWDVYFTSVSSGWIVGESGRIFVTTDGGSSWAQQSSGFSNTSLSSVTFVSPSTGWAAGGNGNIIKTTNAGEEWVSQSSGVIHYLTSVYFLNPTTGWITGYSGTILKTTNAGLNWIKENSGADHAFESVWFTSERSGIAVGNYYDTNGIIKGSIFRYSEPVPDLCMTGEAVLNYFGASAISAGDVNGDGYNDFIAGAPDFNNKQGRSYLYFGGADPDNNADVIFNGEASWYPFFGHSSAGAGDVNGDGYDDIIIGAYGWSGVNGRAYIYFGGMNMDNIPDVIMEGEQLFNDFGMSVSSAGDINEDGYDDVIVNARGYNNWTGRAYIFFGGSSMNNVPDIIFTGENTGDQFGTKVANAGDVNGDGKPDIITSAYRYGNNTGRAYVYFGGAGMDNIADVVITGESAGDLFGSAVATAGDVNKDGYSDVIVQAQDFGSGTGRAYLYFGGQGMDNTADIVFTGEAQNNNFGSVTYNQDINGDGYSDILIGAPGYSNNRGRAYGFFGGSGMDNVPDLIITGENENDLYGITTSSAGDINSDGYNDFAVAGYGYNNSTGRVCIFFGSGEPLSNCSISGPSRIPVGSVNVIYRSTLPDGYWTLTNYDNTQAAIVSSNNHDSVLVDAGNERGHFVLFYQNISTILCSKHVYTDDPLPAELTSFTSSVTGNNIKLNWTTASEVNNSGFDVERSSIKGQTSEEWVKAGFVQGKGTTAAPSNYEFTDKGVAQGKYNYRLRQIDYNGNFKYYELAGVVCTGIPDNYNLSQNYPNPFNPITTISFDIPENGHITLKIYDILGKEIKTLVNEIKAAGYYKVQLNSTDLSSGTYFCRMEAGNYVAVKKLVVLK